MKSRSPEVGATATQPRRAAPPEQSRVTPAPAVKAAWASRPPEPQEKPSAAKKPDRPASTPKGLGAWLSGVAAVMKTAEAPGPDKRPPKGHMARQALLELASSGDYTSLAKLDEAEVQWLASFLDSSMDRDELHRLVQANTSIPKEVLEDIPDTEQLVKGLLQTVKAPVVSGGDPGVVDFSTGLAGGDMPTGDTARIPAGSRHVYASFDNAGELEGRSEVVAVWRNELEQRVVFYECEKLRPDTPRNYVWLRYPKGWKGGQYRLDLYDPGNGFKHLATGVFGVD